MKRTQYITIALVLMMALAGCSGWGTDGPAQSDDQNESNTTELENASNETNESENTSESNSTTTTSENSATDDDGDDDGDGDASSSSDSSDSEDSPDESESGESPDASDSDSSDSEQSQDSEGDDSADPSSDPEPQGSDPGDDGSSGADEDDSTEDSDADDESENTTDESEDQSEPAPEPEPPGNESDENETNESEPEPEPETVTLEVFAGEISPTEGAEIVVENIETGETWSATTGEDGAVTFEVPTGEYHVRGVDTAGNEDHERIILEGDRQVTLPALAGPVPPEHDVTVTVTDAVSGEPIEDATVSGIGNTYHQAIGEPGFGGYTNSEGVFSTTAYESGYDVTVDADGYETEYGSTLVEGETEINVELDRADQMHELTLTVRVVDENGDPVEGETVEWRPSTDGGAVTDENGEVVIEGQSSDPTDVIQTEVTVDGETYLAHRTADGETLEVVVPQGTEAPNETTETIEPNETNESAAA